tara:strand:- start:234 stop:398 length:165 start_codon:yes stop_codon:yes gene_type:complete
MPKYSVSVAADVIDTIEAASRDEAESILIDKVNDLLSKGLKGKFSVIQNYMGDE